MRKNESLARLFGFSRSARAAQHTTGGARGARDRSPRFESLEDRRVLAITVDTLADTVDAGDGVTSLREAITMANDTAGVDEIDFSVTGTIALTDGELVVTDDLIITGPGSDLLTIDAQQNSRVLVFGEGQFVLNGSLELSGLSLVNGRTTANDADGRGGAVRFRGISGDLTINDSVISGNSTAGDEAYGGGVFSYGSLTLNGTTISGNSTAGIAALGGGALAFGDITLEQSTVSGNATTGDESYGGGLVSQNGVYLYNSSVTGNSTSGNSDPNNPFIDVAGARGGGGGVFATNGDVIVDGSTISGNSTSGSQAAGGGVFALNGDVILDAAVVSGNSTNFSNPGSGFAAHGGGVAAANGFITVRDSTVADNSVADINSLGGGLFAVSGEVTVENSTVSGNSATGAASTGGGIATLTGSIEVSNSTLSGNSAIRGGGVDTDTGAVTITTSTVTNNTSTTGGGGVNIEDAGDAVSTLTIANSIVSGNNGPAAAPDVRTNTAGSNPTTLAVDFSLIGDTAGSGVDGSTGTSNLLNQSANLGPLADNGGPTLTHAPLSGSPVIDAGDPMIASAPQFDQRGAPFARVLDGVIDIGAVEIDASGPEQLGDYNLDQIVSAADFTVWRDTIDLAVDPVFSVADGSGNGVVDLADFDVWVQNFDAAPQQAALAQATASSATTVADGGLAIAGVPGLLLPAQPLSPPSDETAAPSAQAATATDAGLLLLLDQDLGAEPSTAASVDSQGGESSGGKETSPAEVDGLEALDALFEALE